MTAPSTVPPTRVAIEMAAYEECLAEAQRLYRRLKDARGADRAAAQRDYDAALQRAREMARRLA